jgi:hypothetical protein
MALALALAVGFGVIWGGFATHALIQASVPSSCATGLGTSTCHGVRVGCVFCLEIK